MRFSVLLRLSLVMIVALTLSACDLLGDSANCDDENFPSFLIPELPTSATVTEASCSTGFNPSYRATFTLAPADLETFQQTTRITDWQTSVPEGVSDAERVANATSVLYGEYGDGIVYTRVTIDTSNPDLYTVYYSNSWVD